MAVNSTLTLWNNTSTPGSFQASEPEYLGSVAYDLADNLVFVGSTTYSAVSSSLANIVSTFNGTTGEGFKVIGVGNQVGGLAYDPASAMMYVATAWPGPGQLLGINSTTLVAQDITNLSGEATGLAYVPTYDQLYVAVADGVDIVNLSTGGLSKTLPFATHQTRVTYDPSNGDVYVMQLSPKGSPTTWNLTVIDPKSASVVATLPGNWQGDLAYVPANGDMYGVQANPGSPAVLSVLSPRNTYLTNVTIGTGFVASSNTVVYDPRDGTVYVTSSGCSPYSGGLFEINVSTNVSQGCTGSVPSPGGAAYSEVSGRIFVSGSSSDSGDTALYQFDPSSGNWTRQTVGFAPSDLAFIPESGDLLIADDWGGSVISVVNVSSDEIVGTVQVGSMNLNSVRQWYILPRALLYDPGNGLVYVAESAVLTGQYGWLQAINLTTLQVSTLSTTILSGPSGLALDVNHSRLFVSSAQTGQVLVFNTSTGNLVTTVGTGGTPQLPAFDPVDQRLFVPSSNTGNVTIINTSSDRIVANITVGGQPDRAFFDPANGLIDVADGGRVVLINATQGTAIGAQSGFRTVSAFAYDASRDRLFISDLLGNGGGEAANLTILNASTDQVLGWTPAGSLCDSLAVNQNTGAVYVALEGSGSVMTVLPRSGPRDFLIDSPLGPTGVAEGPYGTQVTFSAVGLGPDTEYQLAFDEFPGALGTVFGYQVGSFATNASGAASGTFIAEGVGAYPGLGGTWYVDVYELGYFALPTTSPASGQFNVTPAVVTPVPPSGEPGGSISISGYGLAPLGPYLACFEAAPYVRCPASSTNFSADTSGNVPGGVRLSIPGGSNSEIVLSDGNTGIPVADSTFQAVYPVLFTETGLPGGANWSAYLGTTFNWSTSSTLGFVSPGGLVSYEVYAPTGYTASPSSGSLTVSESNLSVSISFQRSSSPQYTVTFTESGLPSATTWSVRLNGTTTSSSSTSIRFQEARGTYSYSVPSVAGYAPSPASGQVSVVSNVTGPMISFSQVPTTWNVTFLERGLPAGETWTLTLGPSTESSATTIVVFSEPAGNYSYRVQAVGNYTPTPSAGTVRVSSQAVTVTIQFASAPPCCHPTTTPSISSIIFGGIVLLLIVATIVAVVSRARRGRSPPPYAAPPGPSMSGRLPPAVPGGAPGAGPAHYCARCGTPATPGGRYCLGCGAPL